MQGYRDSSNRPAHPNDCLGLFSLRVQALTALSIALRHEDEGRNDPVLIGAASALAVLEDDFEALTSVVDEWFRERTGSPIGDPMKSLASAALSETSRRALYSVLDSGIFPNTGEPLTTGEAAVLEEGLRVAGFDPTFGQKGP